MNLYLSLLRRGRYTHAFVSHANVYDVAMGNRYYTKTRENIIVCMYLSIIILFNGCSMQDTKHKVCIVLDRRFKKLDNFYTITTYLIIIEFYAVSPVPAVPIDIYLI